LCLTIKYIRLRKMLNLHGDFDLSFVQLRQIHVVQSASELLDLRLLRETSLLSALALELIKVFLQLGLFC
jgi:hypothetical protein